MLSTWSNKITQIPMWPCSSALEGLQRSRKGHGFKSRRRGIIGNSLFRFSHVYHNEKKMQFSTQDINNNNSADGQQPTAYIHDNF